MPAGTMPRSATGVLTRERVSVIAGGAAGNLTLTGIEVGDRIKSVHHIAASSVAQSGVAAVAHTVSAGEDTANTVDIDTGLGAALEAYSILVLTAAGVNRPLADAAISEAAGVITIADGAATFVLTATDVIHVIAVSSAPGAQGTPVDLTAEFTDPVIAANTISNTGGTATTGGLLLVHWYDLDYGIDEALGWG